MRALARTGTNPKKYMSFSVFQCNGYLLLPAAGYRQRETGAGLNRGANGDYWSYETGGSGSWRLNFNASGTNMKAENRSFALTVRCVQAFTWLLWLKNEIR